MIEGLVSQILDDYHDDKIINQQALFSQPDKEAVCDLLSKLIKIMSVSYTHLDVYKRQSIYRKSL